MDPVTQAALISGGGALLGGVLGGGDQEQFGPGDAIPKHLTQDWRMLGSQIAGMPVPQYYPGQLVQEQNPWLRQSLQNMYQWGNTTGMDYMNQMANYGNLGLGAMGSGLDYMNQLAMGGPSTFQYDQGTYDQVMANLMPGLQGEFEAAMRDPMRVYSEQVIPGINMDAIASGGGFGTAGANQSAIAARGLEDRAADTAAALYSNAANMANQAAYGAGGMNLESALATQGDLLQNYGQYAGLGGNLLTGAYDMGTGNIGMQNQAGQQQQAYAQSLIDAQMNRYMYNQQMPMTHLGNQLALMGQQSMMPQPGVDTTFNNALQGAMAGMGMYNMFQQPTVTPYSVWDASDNYLGAQQWDF